MNKLSNNKHIKVIQTRKYKDVNLYLRFSIENKPLIRQKISLLCKLIGDVSKSYPSKAQMAKARDMLYGISLNATYKVRANIITLCLRYSFINPKFVDASTLDYASFINETLYNSIINEKTLDEAKRNLKDAILRRNDKPASKANQRVIEIISKDNPSFSIYSEDLDYINSIDKIELSDLIKTYKYIINKAQLNLYLCGDVNDSDINILTDYSFENRKEVELKLRKLKCIEKKTISNTKDISQSYLAVVYATPFNKSHKDFFAWFLGNAFLGITPTSLLFSEVREKMSLCYSIQAIDYKIEGLVKIVTSIDGKNKNKAIKAIENQVERIKNIDYDLSKFEITKTLLCNTLLGTYDDLDGLIDYYYESYISNFNYSIEEYCQNIMKVTPFDISRVFKEYKHYFNYILIGNKHE